MQKLTTLVICAAATIAAPLGAHAADRYLPANTLQESAPGPGSAIPNVTIIALNALPFDMQLQVGATVAHANKDDIQVLRSSIDATPEASAALKARGMSSAEVIAALVDEEGGLTLIINEEA